MRRSSGCGRPGRARFNTSLLIQKGDGLMDVRPGPAGDVEEKASPTRRLRLDLRTGLAAIGCFALLAWAYPSIVERFNRAASDAKILRVGKTTERRKAVRELAVIGLKNPEAVVEPLCKALAEDKDPIVRQESARSLGAIVEKSSRAGSAPPWFSTIRTTLTTALDDPDPSTREAAASRLGVFGPLFTDDSPRLIRALAEDESPEVRTASAYSLGRYKGASQQAIMQLLKGMEDPVRSVASACSESLSGLTASVGSIPDLIVAVDKGSAEKRVRAAGLLGRIGPDAIDAVPSLIAVLKTSPPDLFREAEATGRTWDPVWSCAEALGRIAPKSKRSGEVVRSLAELLSSDRRERVSAAAQALIPFGNEAASAVPALVSALKQTFIPPRTGEGGAALAVALGEIAPGSSKADEAIAVLVVGLKANDEFAIVRATTALGRFGPKARSAIPDLQALLTHVSLPIRVEAARALTAIEDKAAR